MKWRYQKSNDNEKVVSYVEDTPKVIDMLEQLNVFVYEQLNTTKSDNVPLFIYKENLAEIGEDDQGTKFQMLLTKI